MKTIYFGIKKTSGIHNACDARSFRNVIRTENIDAIGFSSHS